MRDSRLRLAGAFALSASLLLPATPLPGGELRAQEVEAAAHPSPLRTLTLEEAYEMAERHSPGYRQARNDMELAGPASRQALGAFLPQVSLNAGTSHGMNRVNIAEDIFGNPSPNPNAQTSFTSASNQGIGMSLSLFEGGARFHRRAQSRAEAVQRASTAEVRLTTLRAGVARAFFDAQQRSEQLELEEGLLEGRLRDLEATRRLFSLASRSRADVLGAELEVRQQERQIEDTRSEYRKALLSLRTLLGNPEMQEFALVAEEIEVFDPRLLDIERILARTLANNPRIRTAEARTDMSRAQSAAASAARWPTVSISGNFSRASFGPDRTRLFEVLPSDRSSGSLGLNVSLPVFQRFGPSLQIAQAEVNERNAREDLRQTHMETEEGVRARLIDLENAFRNLGIEEGSRELADERLRLVQEEYRLAGRRFEDLQNAVRSASTARRQALAARHTFMQARIALEETIGVTIETPRGPAGHSPSPR